MAAYEVLLLNTAIPQIQAAQSGDTYVVPRDIAFSTVANLANGTNLLPSLTFSSDTNTGIYREGADALGFTAGGGTNQMVLTSTGLGIGTNNPTQKLDVRAAAGGIYLSSTTGTNQVALQTNNSGGDFYFGIDNSAGNNFNTNTAYAGVLWRSGANPICFVNNSTEKMRLDSSGNLGLGVTPSAWSGSYKVFQFGGRGAVWNSADTSALSHNFYNDGTGNKRIAADYATLYQQVVGQHQWLTAGSSTAGSAISFTQAMTLDASGNLGVGATSPINNSGYGGLSLNGTSGALFSLMTNGTESSRIASLGNETSVQCKATTGYITFVQGVTGGTERARISSDGTFRVKGAGTAGSTDAVQFSGSAPASAMTLDASGNLLVGTTNSSLGATDGVVIAPLESAWTVSNSGNVPIRIYNKGSSGTRYCMEFRTASTAVGSITHDGTNTAYNTSSDYRLKDNQQPLTGSGAFIDALKPKTWDWKSGGKGVGFIAHEVQEVSPGSVVGEKDAVNADGKPIMQAMEYGSAEFIANIIAELQSLRARVAQLEQGA